SQPLCGDFKDWQVGYVEKNCFADHKGCYIPRVQYQNSEHWGPNIHNGPVYWESTADTSNGFVYLMPEKDYLKQFRYNLNTHQIETNPSNTSYPTRACDGMPGGAISLSANGKKDGIIWAIVPQGDGQFSPVDGLMYAFKADDLTMIYEDP